MKSSNETNEICAALAKAQGIINNPSKGVKNPHFKSNYADLSAGINAIREGLSAHGIAFIQSPRMEGEVMMLDTRLTHSTGQYFEAEWPVCKLPAAPQQIGSALTYARRYSLFSMVGIAGEDDDGNAANVAPTPPPPPGERISDGQADQLRALLHNLTEDDEVKFLEWAGVDFLGEIPAERFGVALRALEKKIASKPKD